MKKWVMRMLESILKLSLLIGVFGVLHPLTAGAGKPNILFIAIDDQNDWLGCLGGHPQVKTPHIDALAKRGTVFSNAHCQAPLCNPSRSSLLLGLRPSSTGIYGLAPGIREVERTKDKVTLPQTFTQAGYHTYTCGKIFHDGSLRPEEKAVEFLEWGPALGIGRLKTPIANLPIEGRHPAMDWGPFPLDEKQHGDFRIAAAAVKALQDVPAGKPFFVAAGFRLPHVPCFAPQPWFDLYPEDQLKMPEVKENDRDDLPKFADFLHWKLPEPRLSTLKKYNEWKALVRAYLACVSYMDEQVGKVIAALDQTGRAGETIIVLWSDHGWHLGEKGISGKNTLWNESTRVPLIFAGPGITPAAVCDQPAELLDIFPTLLELAQLPARPDLEGHSLMPQLRDAKAERPWPAITTHNQGNHTIRTKDWRYIRYADGSEELYDEKADFNEWTNLANEPKHQKIKAELAKWLPKVDLPPVPGSKNRVLTYEPGTGEVIWEDQPVDKRASLPEP